MAHLGTFSTVHCSRHDWKWRFDVGDADVSLTSIDESPLALSAVRRGSERSRLDGCRCSRRGAAAGADLEQQIDHPA
jgi:hypothetical protein